MAHRHHSLPVLLGLLVGVILGIGTVQVAELSADLLLARTDLNYRSQRYNRVLDMEQMNRSDGLEGARALDWSTADTRTEKAPATALRGSAIEKLRFCDGQSATRRSQCLINAANQILQEEADGQ